MPKFEGAKEISEAEKERSLKAIDKKTGGATKLAQDFRAKLDDVGRRVNRPEKIVQPRCRVCQHENRDYIDGQLAAADVNLSQLARKLPPLEDGKRINRRSLASHAKNHLNTEQGVLREIMIFEAERAGKSWEESVTGAFTHRGLMEISSTRRSSTESAISRSYQYSSSKGVMTRSLRFSRWYSRAQVQGLS